MTKLIIVRHGQSIANAENKFNITICDYKYIANDKYNNIRHNFTPTYGTNEFSTRYDGTNIVNRDNVRGDEGYIVQIPIEYFEYERKEDLYSFLKGVNNDTFSSGKIEKGKYLCQVFSSQNQIGGILYYVLKLDKNETNTIK